MIKKIIIFSIFMFKIVIGTLAAESHVLELKIIGGGTNLSSSVKRVMENNAVKLLTMMSDAQASGSKTLNFNGISISQGAKNSILQMWKYQPLRVWADDDVPPLIEENLLNIYAVKSYQVRNIPVRLFPQETPGKDKYSEVAINFSANGTIEDFNITIGRNQYDKIVKEARTVQDKENRYMLASWMDKLQSAYISKDTEELYRLFDKDAMIITGVRTFKRTGTEVKFKNSATFDYYVKNREQYMSSLKKVFAKNKKVRVEFLNQDYGCNENVILTDGNGEKTPRYYMVWCTQDWKNLDGQGSITYHDTGRLFVLWDFKNPEAPTILVRAWTHPDDPKQFDENDFILSDDKW